MNANQDRNGHDDVAAALVSLARSQMRWSVRYARKGLIRLSAKYRSDAWWHLGKARQKRDLADELRQRRAA